MAAKYYGILITTPVDIRSTFGRLIYDKGWHGGNRKKRIRMPGYKEEDALCVICGMADSQYHWICECKGANLKEERAVLRKDARALAMDILETITVVDSADTETLHALACSINSYYLRHIDNPVENSERIWLNNWNPEQLHSWSEGIHAPDLDSPIDNSDGELASVPTMAYAPTINEERLPRLRQTTKLPGCDTGALFKGAFACRIIRLRERFATYTGVYDPKNAMMHYVYHDEVTQLTRDAWDHKHSRVICLAGYLHDPLDDLKANCRLIKQERLLRVEALRDIQHHEELLLAYGEDYWLNNDFSVNILQQAMVAYGTGSTRFAWHAKIHKTSARLTVQSVDALEETMIALPRTTETGIKCRRAMGNKPQWSAATM
eukprot:gene42132-biopygen6360